MKNLLPAILLLTCHLAFGQSAETQLVDGLHKQKFEWLLNKQYDSLELLLDNDLQYIHSNGWIQTKRQVIDELKKGKPVYLNINVEESKVALYPNCAIVTGKGLFKGLLEDKTEFNIRLLYTEVYVKSKQRWHLVSRQATKI